MNRIAVKPNFEDDQSIQEAAMEFIEKDILKKKKKSAAENQNDDKKNQKGKPKPQIIITKGRLGAKNRKKNIDDEARLNAKNLQQDSQIVGMEEIHWKVNFITRQLDELRAAIESPNPNIYDMLYDALDLYTEKRKRTQIELLNEVVFELKRDFNDEFNELEAQK